MCTWVARSVAGDRSAAAKRSKPSPSSSSASSPPSQGAAAPAPPFLGLPTPNHTVALPESEPPAPGTSTGFEAPGLTSLLPAASPPAGALGAARET